MHVYIMQKSNRSGIYDRVLKQSICLQMMITTNIYEQAYCYAHTEDLFWISYQIHHLLVVNIVSQIFVAINLLERSVIQQYLSVALSNEYQTLN